MKSKDIQPGLLYPARLSFKIEGEIKNFPDQKKLKKFVITKPVLQQILRGMLQELEEREEKNTEDSKKNENGYKCIPINNHFIYKWKDSGKIGGSGVHFLLHTGETPS